MRRDVTWHEAAVDMGKFLETVRAARGALADVQKRLQTWEDHMGIRREELIINGRAWYKTRLAAVGGAACAVKRKAVIVRKIERAGALIEFDNGKQFKVPFGQLEPDEEFLDAHDRKETEKKERVSRESTLTDVSAPKPLTYKLSEKLEADDDEDAVEDSAARQRQRQDALDQLAALSRKTGRHPAVLAPGLKAEAGLQSVRERRQAELFSFTGMRPEDEYEEPETSEGQPVPVPAPEPARERPPVVVPVPEKPKTAPAPQEPPRAVVDPVQALLDRIRAEFEGLISSEGELEGRIELLGAQLNEAETALVANRARQKVLTMQERQMMLASGKPLPAPAVTVPVTEPVTPVIEPGHVAAGMFGRISPDLADRLRALASQRAPYTGKQRGRPRKERRA